MAPAAHGLVVRDCDAQLAGLRTRLFHQVTVGRRDLVKSFEGGESRLGSIAEQAPDRRAVALVCRIPRTFVDCNRLLEAPKKTSGDLRLTPGLPPWITHPDDHELLTFPPSTSTSILRWPSMRVIGSTTMRLLISSSS